MTSKGLVAAVLLVCTWAFSEAQSNCKGRCGMGYYRGYTCQCDFSCLLYGECCKDYERLCTSKSSCKGRCGETFKRGRTCNCDAECVKYNQCCPDFEDHCNEMEEVEGEAPVNPESCDNNVERKPTELPQETTEQPLGTTLSEGNDPVDSLIPTVNPASFQNDDPDSASKQTAEADVPDPSPLPDGSSGFGATASELSLEEFTQEPPLPDLDGFEVFPEPPTTTASQDETTEPSATTASQDETTEPPATTASEDEKTEPPATTASQDETTEPPATTASEDEKTEPPATTASQDETTEPPATTASQDEKTEPPATTASQDETEPPATTAPQDEATEPPATTASQDETEPPATTAPQDEATEPPATTASEDETTEPPVTTASQDETTKPSATTASQEETTEPPATTASQDETTEPPVTTAPQDEATEPPATTASQDKTEPPATTASQDETTPSSTNVGPSTAEVTANTDADDSTNAPEPTVSDQPTPEPTKNPTTAPTLPPSEAPETTTLLPESTEATASTLEDKTELTTIFPTTNNPTTNKETTPMPEMATTKPSTLAPASEMSTRATPSSAVDTSTAKEPDVTQGSTNAPTSNPSEKPNMEKPFIPAPNDKPVLNGLDDSTEYPADDSNDMNLCSGRPISGVTTLSNGTVVVFRGHFFWVLDRNRVPGPAQGITQVWGIPSPIDTIFTRCNCQGKTYIFKGPQYWRYENDVLDPGFPKVIETGFDGLRGHITAALSVPQYNRRRESVYFFKRGGNVQKYSYQFGTNPTCGRKVQYAVYTHGNRIARQAPAQVSLLERTINYRTSWRGFPTTITAAVSIPNKREPEGYSYYVFSRAKSYRVRIERDRPVIAAAKPNTSHQSNEVFKCPRKLPESQ